MLVPSFETRLDANVMVGRVAFGRFDGVHPALAVVSEGGTVHIHWPHCPDKAQVLRFNYEITSIAAGALDASADIDMLMVGTTTNLLAYDVHNNRDIFFKDVADGVNALAIGRPNSLGPVLALAGGNCSVQGFDINGDERLWTVTGDNVSALSLCDVDSDGELELLVGSLDAEIRIYRYEDVLRESTESDAIVGLAPIRGARFAYALANGTVGVYEGDTRLWSSNTTHKVTCIEGFGLDADGVAEVLVGWSDGRLEVRSDESGEVLFEVKMSAPVSAIVKGDYRMDGNVDIIVVAENGQIRGFRPAPEELSQQIPSQLVDEHELTKLRKKKFELLREIEGYKSNIATCKSGEFRPGGVPPNTEISCSLGPNQEERCLELVMSSTNDTLIKAVIVFGDGIFEGENLLNVFSEPSATVFVPLHLQKDIECDMSIQVIVGYRGSSQDHVFEMQHRLPKFSSFVYCRPRDLPTIHSSATVAFTDRLSRVILWLNHSFLLNYEQKNSTNSLRIGFTSLRTDATLALHVSTDGGGEFRVQSDDMTLAGDILQDWFGYIAAEHMSAIANFPLEMQTFKSVLEDVEQYNQIRGRLCADMADSSNLVKELVVRAEDARMLQDMDHMSDIYSELYDLNQELLGEFRKRSTNHERLLKSLKEVNLMIQRASRLRYGKHKAEFISACRNAVKTNNVQSLFGLIKQGH